MSEQYTHLSCFVKLLQRVKTNCHFFTSSSQVPDTPSVNVPGVTDQKAQSSCHALSSPLLSSPPVLLPAAEQQPSGLSDSTAVGPAR